MVRLVKERLAEGGGREVMDAHQAADFLGLAPSTVRSMGAEGRIPRHAFSKARYVYLRSELLEWVRSRPPLGEHLGEYPHTPQEGPTRGQKRGPRKRRPS